MLTVADAAARVLVRLPDGQHGVLVGITARTRMAKVRTLEGRHRRLPARMLTKIPERKEP